MEQWWTLVVEYLQNPQAAAYFQAAVKVIVGLFLGRIAGKGVVRLFLDNEDAHGAMILRRFTFYAIFGIFVASALMDLGFELGVLLGAAGILTVAIGFASQTSASNIISGLFLLGERPFTVGDIIKVNGTIGEVLSVDMLSVKLRTMDNTFVRVPNETIIKSELTNIRHFPIRRIDLVVGVAYHEDMREVRRVLLEVADHNALCLEEPAPKIFFTGFDDSALSHEFRVWAKTENFIDLRNSLAIEIKEAFDEHNIEIPFPHRTIYTGTVTEPFPVRHSKDAAGPAAEQPASDAASSPDSVGKEV